EPVTRATVLKSIKPVEELRKALRILEQLKTQTTIDEGSIQALRLASIQVSSNASKDPVLYLKPLEAIKRIVIGLQNKQAVSLQDIALSQNALQKIAGIPSLLPSKKHVKPAPSLSEQYFRNLQKSTLQ
ncbi:MAG: hypothetical protein ABIS69_00275, partial [Sediminibacterium sp.]